MDAGLPEPGTVDDVLADAGSAGFATNVRMLRKWTEKGLLASPERRSLGRGHGQAPAVYTSHQRAMLRWLAEHQANNAHFDQLAALVIYTWLYHADEWVDDKQALAALRTAAGSPRKSQAAAMKGAKELVRSIDFRSAPPLVRNPLINHLQTQLQRGIIEPERLKPLVAAVLDAPGLVVLRGPAGAQLSTDTLVELLAARARGMSKLGVTTVTQMSAVRRMHRAAWLQYSTDRPTLHAEAAPDIKHLFEEPAAKQQLDGAVPTALYLLGVLAERPDLTTEGQLS